MNFQGLKALIRLQAHRLLNHSLDDDFIVLGFNHYGLRSHLRPQIVNPYLSTFRLHRSLITLGKVRKTMKLASAEI